MVNIDERVMTMKFDNSQFRRAAQETISALDKLKSSMKMEGAAKGFSKIGDPVKTLAKSLKSSNIEGELKSISSAASTSFSEMGRAADNVNLDGVASGVENVKTSLFSLGNVATIALGGLATKGIEKTLRGLKGLYDNTLGQISTGGMRRAKNLEQANYMLGGIMETEAQVKAVMEAANAAVTGTAYGLDEAAKAAGQFAASNVPIERMEATLKGVAGVAAMTSSSFDEISHIFTSVAGSGKLMTQQLRQFEGRGLNVAAKLAEHFKVTEGELREMVTKGKVSFEEFSEAMSDAYGDQAAKANETYAGSLSNLRAALSRIGADTAAVRLEGLRDVFNALRLIVNGVHNALKPFIAMLNNNLRDAFAGVVGPMMKVADAFTAFYDSTRGPQFAGALRPVVEFVQDIGMVGGLVIEVLRDMVAVIFGATPRFIEMSETTTSAGTKIQHIFRKLLSVIMLIPETIGMVIKAFRGTSDSAKSVGDSILDIVDGIASFLYLTAEFIRKTKIFEVGATVLGFALRIVVNVISALMKGISLLITGLVKLTNPIKLVRDLFSSLKESFSSLFDSLKAGVFDKFVRGIVSGVKAIKRVAGRFSIPKFFEGFALPKVNLSRFRDILKIFDNIRESFSKMGQGLKEVDWSPITGMFSGGLNLPSFGDIRGIGAGIGSSVMGGLSNLSWTPVVNFANEVKLAFIDLQNYLRGISWSTVWSNIKTNFASGSKTIGSTLSTLKDNVLSAGKTVGEALSDFGDWIIDGLRNVDWPNVGKTIGEGIVKSIAFIAGSAVAISSAIGDFFKGVFDAIDWSAVLDGVTDLVDTVTGAFKEIGQAFRGEEIDTSYLEDALGSATAEITIKTTQDLGAQAKNIRGYIGDFFSALFGTGPELTAAESELYMGAVNFGDSIRSISGVIKNPLGKVKDTVTAEFTGFGETVKSLATGLLEGVNIVEIMNAIGLAFTGAGIYKLSETLETFAAVPEAIAGAFKSIGGAITSLGEAAKIEAQGNAILKVAIAFGVLAASVWFLSKIPWDQLKVGLGAVLILIGTLVASAVILDKMLSDDAAEKLSKLGNAFMKIGIAVGILAASIWFLGKMDPKSLLTGFVAVLGTIVALGAGAALAGTAKALTGMGFAFIGLAAGVAILAGAFLTFKMINWEEITKGLATLAVAVLAISIAARIADGKKLAGAGVAMLGVGAGLWALAYGMKAVADLDVQQLTTGLSVLAAVMLGLGALSKFGGSNFVTTAGALVGISFALVALAYAIGLIADIDFGDAFWGMTVLIAGLAGLGLALKAFPPTLPALAGSLVGIAGALAILVAAIYILGKMDFGTLAQGVGAIAVTLTALGLAMSRIPPNSAVNMLGMAAAFIGLAAAVYILAEAMKTLEVVDWGSLGKAAAIAASVVAIIAGLGIFGEKLGSGLVAVGLGLGALGLGLGAIAGAAWIFSDAVSKIVESMQTLVDIGPHIKDALGQAGEGITEFANGASEGIRQLMDDIGFWDFGKLGGVVNLFESFEKIPVDIGARMEGLVSGLTTLQDVMPTLMELKEFSGGGGNANFLLQFFEAFSQIPVDAGDSLKGLVDGFRALDDESIWNVMGKLSAMHEQGGAKSWFGNFEGTSYISDFFRSFNDIDTDVADKITGVVSGLQQIESVWQTIERLKYLHQGTGERGMLGGNTDSTNYISDFFRAFNDIEDNVGEKITSVASALTQVEEVWQTIERLKYLEQGTGDRGWFGGNTDSTNYISDFFRAFNDVDPSAGEKLSSVVSAIKQLGDTWGTIQQLQMFGVDGGETGGLSNLTAMFRELSKGIPTDLGEKLSAASSGIDELGNAAPKLSEAVGTLTSIDTGGLGDIMDNIKNAFASGFSDGLTQAAEAISSAVTAMVSAITDRSSDFDAAGRVLGGAIATGINARKSDVQDAGKEIGSVAAHGVETGRQGMHDAGAYIAAGVASGIEAGQSAAITAAVNLAKAAINAARAELDIRSPSRVFKQMGVYVSEGLGIGIDSGQNGIRKAGRALAQAGIDGFNEADFDAENAGQVFADSIARGMANSSFNQRLRQLSTHAKAAHATAVKEQKLKEMDDKDRADEERKRIYKEVEEARKAVSEAKEDAANSAEDAKTEKAKASKAQSDKTQSKSAATKAARDAQREKEKITDAEERYQKAIRERDKYEYRMHGEEAGVQFVEGVAEGLMSDKEAIPSVAEILSDLLMGEVKTLKTKVGDFKDLFGGVSTALNTTKSMGENIRDLSRAFKRLGSATSSRSIQRNVGMMFDSIVSFIGGIQSLIGILEVFEPFLPSLLGNFEASLPAIAAMVAPFAPELAASLGGGLAAAVPAILGPATAIIAAVAGIGIFLWDQANDQTILKAFKAMFAGVGDFIAKLPDMLVNGILTLLQGLKNTLADLPGLVEFILNTIVDVFESVITALPSLIPALIEGIIDAILWAVLNAPGLLLEVAEVLINGLARAIEVAIKGLIDLLLMPFRWLMGEVGGTIDLVSIFQGAVQRLSNALGGILAGVLNLILSPFRGLYNAIADIFGFQKLGENMVEDLKRGIIGAMRTGVDFIAAPFIHLWNFIAGLFGWDKVATNAASQFIFGVEGSLKDGSGKVASAAERMAALMDKHVTSSSRDTLADISALIEEQVRKIQQGATDGIALGGEATRDAANRVWSDIEDIFDMHGLGMGELDALKEAFYRGTVNPKTMVSSFTNVFDHIQRILTLNEVGEGAVESLNQSMIDAITQGMMDESMGEFGDHGYQTGTELVDGMIRGMDLTRSEMKAVSDSVWSDIETVFDFYGLGEEGLNELKRSYQAGTQHPETYSATFEKVFDEIEKQLLLKDIGTESVGALRTSMVDTVTNLLQPDVRDSFSDVRDETRSIFSRESGSAIGTGFVEGIIEGIVNTFRGLWDFVTRPFRDFWSWLTGLFSGGSSLGGGFISNLIDGLTGGLRSIWDTGVNIVEGVVGGIASVGEKVVNGAVDLGTRLVNGIKNFFGIKSPSRLMATYGEYITKGLAVGIDRGGDDAVGSMFGLGQDVLDTARAIIDGVHEAFEDSDEFTITPVLDLTNIKSGVKDIGSLVSSEGLNLDSTISNTSDISDILSGLSTEPAVINNVTNIEFNQTNTSPESLTEYEIYRNTERALADITTRKK